MPYRGINKFSRFLILLPTSLALLTSCKVKNSGLSGVPFRTTIKVKENLPHKEFEVYSGGEAQKFKNLYISSDSRYALMSSSKARGRDHGSAQLWDLKANARVFDFDGNRPRFTPDNEHILTSSGELYLVSDMVAGNLENLGLRQEHWQALEALEPVDSRIFRNYAAVEFVSSDKTTFLIQYSNSGQHIAYILNINSSKIIRLIIDGGTARNTEQSNVQKILQIFGFTPDSQSLYVLNAEIEFKDTGRTRGDGTKIYRQIVSKYLATLAMDSQETKNIYSFPDRQGALYLTANGRLVSKCGSSSNLCVIDIGEQKVIYQTEVDIWGTVISDANGERVVVMKSYSSADNVDFRSGATKSDTSMRAIDLSRKSKGADGELLEGGVWKTDSPWNSATKDFRREAHDSVSITDSVIGVLRSSCRLKAQWDCKQKFQIYHSN